MAGRGWAAAVRGLQRFWVPLSICLALSPGLAAAAEVQAPHPMEFANLSAAKQDVIRESVHRQMMAATPEERMRYRIAIRQALERLTPEERRKLSELTVQRWKQLSPQQHAAAEERKKALLGIMTPEERQQAAEQRRLLLQLMPSGEQKQLEQPLPTR